jgi:hypothetical protein
VPLTSSLEGGGWLKPCSGCNTPEINRSPLDRRLVGFQEQSGRVRKTSPLPGFEDINKLINMLINVLYNHGFIMVQNGYLTL